MKKIALFMLLVFVLVAINPVIVSAASCNAVDISGKKLAYQQQMADYDKKIGDLKEKTEKINQEMEEMERKKRAMHRIFGITIPPLGYVFWLFGYCP